MEKKQLFDSSLVGFHPEIFIPKFKLDINIDDYDIYEDFNVTKYITLDNNFIDIYNKIKEAELCSILLSITNNNSDNSEVILSGYKGAISLFFRDTVIVKTTGKILISTFDIVSINTSSKTAYINFIRKVISQSDLDNTVVRLTTTVNGLTNLNPGDFNETVTLTDEEYNALKEVPVGEIFMLINNIDFVSFLVFKINDNSFRANRDYLDGNLSNRSLISFLIELGETNQATFKGNVAKLIDPDNYLAKDNTTEYTPTANYNPATKKYVDDKDAVAKLRLYNGKISLQHNAGKSLINDTCESFADLITIFDNMVQLDGTSFTNPFTGMTLPTNVNEFLEAFQTFQSTYNVYDSGHLVEPIIGAHASDENIIIVGFYRHNIGPAEIQFGDVSYLNWQANSIFGIGINSSNGNYVQIDSYQISTLSLDRGLVANLINKINNLDLSDYIKKNNTTAYTPTGAYNPATKKYVDDKIDKPLFDISNLLLKVRNSGRDTPIDVTDEIINLFGSVNAVRTDSGKYRFVTGGTFINFNSFLNINEFTFSAALGGRINGNDDPTVYSNKNSITIYYYNFKINEDNTVVTGYYNNTNIIKDPDRPNQYLSADGTYKYPYAAGIYFGEDNRQATNNKYWGNYIIRKEDNSGDGTLILISDCTQLFDEISTTNIITDSIFGIGGYGILNRIANNSYPYCKPILIEAIAGVNAKSTYYQLYTSNWIITPCIIKYQNKYYVAIRFGNLNDRHLTVMGSYLNIIGQSSNLLDSYIYLNCKEGQLYPTGVEVIREGTYFDKDNIKNDRNNLLAKTNEDGYMSKEDKTKLDNTPVQKILTESEYAALGTAPETDNVLYFVTPD